MAHQAACSYVLRQAGADLGAGGHGFESRHPDLVGLTPLGGPLHRTEWPAGPHTWPKPGGHGEHMLPPTSGLTTDLTPGRCLLESRRLLRAAAGLGAKVPASRRRM